MKAPSSARTAEWAARLAPGGVASLDALRLCAGIECCEHDGELWLRGADEMPRTVPWTWRYEIHDGTLLREPGHILPCGTLPAGEWRSLAEAFRLLVPLRSRAGIAPPPITLSLVRCGECHEPAMIEISARDWLAFAETAPAVRLAALRFARTDSGRVFIAGAPLPALPCARFTVREGIAVPAGFTWSPRVTAATVRSALRLEEAEMAVFFHGGTCLRIPARAWISASRAAARADVR